MEHMRIQQMTSTRLPTAEGQFELFLYRSNRDDKEHLALVMGNVTNVETPLVRVHSECFTGDVLRSQRCDCGPQLRRAMQLIAAEGQGIIIYLRQEGRGIGLLDKLRAYNLQDAGYDTVEANLALGHQADARDYTVAALVLQELGVGRVRLLTNNPAKIAALTKLGIAVEAREPLVTAVTRENAAYLRTKVERMHHLLQLDDLSAHAAALSAAARANGGGRPYVTLSYAQSLDGSITTQRGQPTAISGPESMRLTHQLRAAHDAILVGIDTVLADNPSLTVRLAPGDDPQPVVLDSKLRFPLDAQLLQQHKPPWIMTTEAADAMQCQAIKAAGARVWQLPADENGRVDLAAMLQQLHRLGVHSLMVEGGARVITSFLAARLVDRLVVTVSPRLLGGLNAVTNLSQRLNGHGLPRLHNPRYRWLGQDMVLFGEVVWERRGD